MTSNLDLSAQYGQTAGQSQWGTNPTRGLNKGWQETETKVNALLKIPVIPKSGNYTVVEADNNDVIVFSATATLTLDSSLANFNVKVVNDKDTSGDVTISPDSGTINGVASIILQPGESAWVFRYASGEWSALAHNGYFVKPIRAADGTNALPSMTFGGDPDTGFYSVSSNVLGITTGGTQRVTVNSSGVNITSGGLNITSGNIAVTSGNLTLTSGSATLTSGNLTLSAGTISATSGSTAIATLTCTDGGNLGPALKLYHNSASPATNDLHGRLSFSGNSSTGVEREYSAIVPSIADATNTSEDGNILFLAMVNGTLGTRFGLYGADIGIAKTPANALNTVGIMLRGDGTADFSAGSACLNVNRTTDGNLVVFYGAGTQQGQIAISGTTVAYGTFCGVHNSQLYGWAVNRKAKPEPILEGTVMATVDEMCEWFVEIETDENGALVKHSLYQGDMIPGSAWATDRVVYEKVEDGTETVEETVNAEVELFDADGKPVTAIMPVKRQLVRPTYKIVERTVVHNHVIAVEANDQLARCKISDVPGDRAVYGVFGNFDEDGEPVIRSLGTTTARIGKDIDVKDLQRGMLLESAGDGTARPQADDIMRASTLGKVTAAVCIRKHDDGSWLVPVALYSG